MGSVIMWDETVLNIPGSLPVHYISTAPEGKMKHKSDAQKHSAHIIHNHWSSNLYISDLSVILWIQVIGAGQVPFFHLSFSSSLSVVLEMRVLEVQTVLCHIFQYYCDETSGCSSLNRFTTAKNL